MSIVERRHVLFLIDQLATTFGGAEGVLVKITRFLPPERYRCSVATFAGDEGRISSEGFRCPVYFFPLRRIHGPEALMVALQLSRLIRSERVSIVHTFFPASDLFGALVARLAGCPAIVSSRRDMGFQRSARHRVAYRLARRLYDQVHAVSEGVRSAHIQEDGLDPNKVFTVPNGVDLDDIDAAVPAGPSEPVVVCVANVRVVKGLDCLVRTAALVCRRVPSARFLVVGAVQDNEYFARLAKLTQMLGVSDKVGFAGRSVHVASILKSCRVFYLPSRSEGLSNALLEAMACGLPCVATNVGGNGEVIDDGRSGYLVPVDDPEIAADRITLLLQDRVHAFEMGRCGRSTVEMNFTVRAMIDRLAALYDGLLTNMGHVGHRDSNARPPMLSGGHGATVDR